MPRILGIDIPKEKIIGISLTYIFGIGRTLSAKILKEAEIDFQKRAKDLTDEDTAHIVNIIQKNGIRVEGDLKRERAQDIKRLMDIGSWRGYRHKRSLPVRGQRTRTNARTRKGPRKGGMAIIKKTESSPKGA